MKYSIVLPVYNEEEIISSSILKIIEVFVRMDMDWEVVAVDDGSVDNSYETLKNLQAEYPTTLKVVRHPYNKGNGATIKTGIKTATGEALSAWIATVSMTLRTSLRCCPTWVNMIWSWALVLSKLMAPGIVTWPISSITAWHRI